jgi:hypothetical protein
MWQDNAVGAIPVGRKYTGKAATWALIEVRRMTAW